MWNGNWEGSRPYIASAGDETSIGHPETDFEMQRAASSAAEAVNSPFKLTMAGAAATTLAGGSMAWYYHLYGSNVFAMTPAEEGYVTPNLPRN